MIYSYNRLRVTSTCNDINESQKYDVERKKLYTNDTQCIAPFIYVKKKQNEIVIGEIRKCLTQVGTGGLIGKGHKQMLDAYFITWVYTTIKT